MFFTCKHRAVTHTRDSPMRHRGSRMTTPRRHVLCPGVAKKKKFSSGGCFFRIDSIQRECVLDLLVCSMPAIAAAELPMSCSLDLSTSSSLDQLLPLDSQPISHTSVLPKFQAGGLWTARGSFPTLILIRQRLGEKPVSLILHDMPTLGRVSGRNRSALFFPISIVIR